MPDNSFLLLILLVVGFNLLRRFAQQAKVRSGQPGSRPDAAQPKRPVSQPLPPPTPFREAAPVFYPQQPEAPTLFDFTEGGDKSEIFDVDKRQIYTPRILPEQDQPQPKAKAAKQAGQPSPVTSILPAFNPNSLVQAVVMQEVLTRPARRRSRMPRF